MWGRLESSEFLTLKAVVVAVDVPVLSPLHPVSHHPKPDERTLRGSDDEGGGVLTVSLGPGGPEGSSSSASPASVPLILLPVSSL